MTTPNTILVVEDQHDILKFISDALRKENIRVLTASNIRDALNETTKGQPDMAILDLGLPDGDGLTLIQNLRTWSQLPILVLSARSDELDKINALDAGADDYLTKPFAIGELLARVRALLRRRATSQSNESPLIVFGDISVNRAQREVMRGTEALHLTAIEYQLLCIFLANVGKVLTHRYLLNEIWGGTFTENAHYLRIYVGHLRKKLELDPTQPKHILTETGVGYRFVLGD